MSITPRFVHFLPSACALHAHSIESKIFSRARYCPLVCARHRNSTTPQLVQLSSSSRQRFCPLVCALTSCSKLATLPPRLCTLNRWYSPLVCASENLPLPPHLCIHPVYCLQPIPPSLVQSHREDSTGIASEMLHSTTTLPPQLCKAPIETNALRLCEVRTGYHPSTCAAEDAQGMVAIAPPFVHMATGSIAPSLVQCDPTHYPLTCAYLAKKTHTSRCEGFSATHCQQSHFDEAVLQ